MGFYEDFKKIRNRMKAYSKVDIFNLCMDALAQVWGLHLWDVHQKQLPYPMHVLSLLKWGLIYGEHPHNARKPFSSHEFLQFYKDISNLSALNELCASGDPLAIHKITRAIMSHQLNYQKKSGLHGFVLLEIIFVQIGLKYDSDGSMNQICGMSIQEYITLQLILLESIVMNPKLRTFDLNYFQNLFSEYGKDKILNFLQLNSCDFRELEGFLLHDHKRIGKPEYEHAILSSLYKKPLFRERHRFTPYHTALIEANIEFGVYDILKEADPENFCSPFGNAFEEYINIALQNARIKAMREDEIRHYAHRDRVCDFIINDKDTTIFLEAKSAEMHYLTRQNPQQEYLKRTLQNSLISGYQQIITLVDTLRQRKDPFTEGKEVYGIIVTFKDLLLGDPEDIWLEFMKDFMNSMLEKRVAEDLPLNPDKIFVISAYDLDHMLAYATKTNKSISDCLKIAFERNHSGDRTFFFHDNFKDDSIKVLESPHLWATFKSIAARIENALKKSNER
ncbi:MAG: hypothetical protein GX556_09785 [Fibrobacter sp.]|nr:hypothetical protein [Fibrobacter sp.]